MSDILCINSGLKPGVPAVYAVSSSILGNITVGGAPKQTKYAFFKGAKPRKDYFVRQFGDIYVFVFINRIQSGP